MDYTIAEKDVEVTSLQITFDCPVTNRSATVNWKEAVTSGFSDIAGCAWLHIKCPQCGEEHIADNV